MLPRALMFSWITLIAGQVSAASVTVRDAAQPGDFPLVTGGRAASIVVDADDARVVSIAASCLADDIDRVTARKPTMLAESPADPTVVIGTLEHSRAIRSLIESGKLDVADLKGQWESF